MMSNSNKNIKNMSPSPVTMNHFNTVSNEPTIELPEGQQASNKVLRDISKNNFLISPRDNDYEL